MRSSARRARVFSASTPASQSATSASSFSTTTARRRGAARRLLARRDRGRREGGRRRRQPRGRIAARAGRRGLGVRRHAGRLRHDEQPRRLRCAPYQGPPAVGRHRRGPGHGRRSGDRSRARARRPRQRSTPRRRRCGHAARRPARGRDRQPARLRVDRVVGRRVGARPLDRRLAYHHGLGAAAVEIQSVEPNSPAARAGLVDGDLLVKFAGKPVVGVDELHRILRTWPAGMQARIVVIRRGARLDLDITPAWAA